MVTPAAKRQAVAHLCSNFEVSQRRACEVIGADRSSVRYLSLRPDDAVIRSRLRELASVRRRFGYRRLLLMLRGEGVLINHKKLRRLYAEERLQVRRRGGRKRALGTRAPLTLPQRPNQRWSLDFVSDTLTDSRRFRILAGSSFDRIVCRGYWRIGVLCEAHKSNRTSSNTTTNFTSGMRSTSCQSEGIELDIAQKSCARSGIGTTSSML